MAGTSLTPASAPSARCTLPGAVVDVEWQRRAVSRGLKSADDPENAGAWTVVVCWWIVEESLRLATRRQSPRPTRHATNCV
eukprot:7254895-Prymnesium_polylepis.2